MKRTWFHHLHCTTLEAEELITRYRRNGVQAEKSLNQDFLTWTVSVKLPEYKYPPRTPRVLRQRIRGRA